MNDVNKIINTRDDVLTEEAENNKKDIKSIIKDTAKNLADIDIDEIKKNWDDFKKNDKDHKEKPLINKAEDINSGVLDKGAKALDTISKVADKHSVDTRSIIARARNSVLQFPIYVTQTIRANEAQIISKMFERVYTTLVQTVLSHNQILSEDEANGLVFLKRYHSNLKEAAEVFTNKYYEPIDDIDSMMCESIFYSQQLNENCRVDFSVVPCTDQDLILENTRLMNEPLTGFMYLREANENTTTTHAEFKTLSDSELEDIAAERSNIDAEDKRLARSYDGNETDNKAWHARKRLDGAVEKLKDDIKAKKFTEYEYKNGRYVRTAQTSSTTIKKNTDGADVKRAVDAPTLLRDADVKKINGMLPWTIEATFRIRTKDGIDRDIKYIIGIKSVMHLIRAQDLAEDLEELITGEIKSLQKVRYKTGEIKFSDYFWNIKGMKADAAKHINYNKRWINTLKRLSEYKKLNGSLMKKPVEVMAKGNVPIPNGTLILAQPDVTMLTNQTGIDLSKVSNAKRLARSLFLIGIVIVDSSAGTMRVLFPDSDNDWDIQSLSVIDSELSKTDNSQLMKELNRMVNR